MDRIHSDTRPHTFVLQFENDDSRTYFLSAYSEVDLEGWIIAIKLSRLVQLENFLLSPHTHSYGRTHTCTHTCTHSHTHTHTHTHTSYEGLRNTLYELQTKLINMTGQDPLKDKGVSIIGSQISPSRKPVSREGTM